MDHLVCFGDQLIVVSPQWPFSSWRRKCKPQRPGATNSPIESRRKRDFPSVQLLFRSDGVGVLDALCGTTYSFNLIGRTFLFSLKRSQLFELPDIKCKSLNLVCRSLM